MLYVPNLNLHSCVRQSFYRTAFSTSPLLPKWIPAYYEVTSSFCSSPTDLHTLHEKIRYQEFDAVTQMEPGKNSASTFLLTVIIRSFSYRPLGISTQCCRDLGRIMESTEFFSSYNKPSLALPLLHVCPLSSISILHLPIVLSKLASRTNKLQWVFHIIQHLF